MKQESVKDQMAEEPSPATPASAPPAAAPDTNGGAPSSPNPAPSAAISTPAPEPAPKDAAPSVAIQTLLGGEPQPEPKPDDVKPADQKPDDKKDAPKPAEGEKKDPPTGEEQKQAEGDQSGEPAPLPTYEAFTVPEGVTLAETDLASFTKQLGEFERLSKADHGEMQKFGQSLLDRHIAEVKTAVERYTKQAQEHWDRQSNTWKEEFANDPELGGARQQTTANEAKEAIRRFGGTTEQQQAFRKLMDDTKLGNNPHLIRVLSNANRIRSEGTPVPALKPAVKTGKLTKMYGNKSA